MLSSNRRIRASKASTAPQLGGTLAIPLLLLLGREVPHRIDHGAKADAAQQPMLVGIGRGNEWRKPVDSESKHFHQGRLLEPTKRLPTKHSTLHMKSQPRKLKPVNPLAAFMNF